MTPDAFTGLVLVTVHPGHVAPAILADVSLVLGVGRDPAETLREAAQALAVAAPAVEQGGSPELQPGEALAWQPRGGGPAARVRMLPARIEHKRHVRKYAEGELGEDRSFYFRGPEERLNLRAQNLRFFLQVGDGVDDETWEHHLHHHDYSRWISAALKDEDLAADVARVEDDAPRLSALESRARVRAAVEARYTAAS
jgi:hypothetical protein